MIILGSQSPRRREIFKQFGIPHRPVSPSFVEESVPFNGDPSAFACEIALGKAKSLKAKYQDFPILTADTVVFKEGKIFGKPKDAEEAFAMLSELSGSCHQVYTGLALLYQEQCSVQAEMTDVFFNPLTPEQIRSYHQFIEWQDKAGAYAIQMGGGIVIRAIKGCYYNVMGLPINTLNELLHTIGIDLWDYLK